MIKLKTSFILFSAITILFTQTSCLKKQNLEDSNLGPIVDPNAVEEKMATGIGNLDFSDVNVNEFSSVNANSTYEDSQTIKVFNQTITVDTITQTTSQTTINLSYSKTDYINSQNSFSNVRYPLVISNNLSTFAKINKTATANEVRQKDSTNPYFLFRVYAYMAIYGCREDKVTCHNLSSSDSEMALAPSLADSRICPDPVKCIIPVRDIEFDLIDNNRIQSDGKPTRSHYKFVVSRALPFFSKVLQYCVRELVELNGRKVLAEDCVSVNNFAVGD